MPSGRRTMPTGRLLCRLSALRQPGLPLVGIGIQPLLGGVVVGHRTGDVRGDGVLVVVRPGEVLDDRVSRATARRELRRYDLVEVVRRVIAGDLRLVRVAPGRVG